MTAVAPRRALAAAAAHGMTLVDLMVGTAIGLFVVAVMGAVYVGSKTTFMAQESSARLQENGRFAMDTIAADLRMSGFRGCLGATAVVNTLTTPTGVFYDFGQPIWGSRSSGGGWSPALAAPLAALGPDASGDVLVVRRPAGLAWSLVGAMADPTAALPITPTAGFTRGDLVMVADCVAAAVLQATNATPGASGAIEHAPANAAGLVPGLAANGLGRAFANDAQAWRMQTLVYFLAASARQTGRRALWLYRTPVYDGQVALSELVSGVDALAVTYGVDSDGDFAADRFRSAADVSDWARVVSARVELLLSAASASSSTRPQPYTFDGNTVTPTDRRLRTVMSMLVSLRNAVP